MRRVIDFHAHLGDIFLSRNVSFRTGLPRPEDLGDCFADNDRRGFTFSAEGKSAEELQNRMRAGQNRLLYANYENMGRTMDREEAAYMVILPVTPLTSFDEYLAASRLEPRLLPFTNPDYARPKTDMLAKLREDMRNGARGLKLHPVLQNRPLDDELTRAAVELFGEAGLPVLAHVGQSSYYVRDQEAEHPTSPQFGRLECFVDLARRYPRYDLIAAHCGNNYPSRLAELTEGLERVYTDTTFCSAPKIREVVDRLGEDRVLLGTDYPFSDLHYAVEQVEKALGDTPAADKVLYHNAARLLKV